MSCRTRSGITACFLSLYAMFLCRLVTLLCVLCTLAFAEGVSQGESKDDFQRYSVVPILGYTEETEFQVGVMSLFFLRPDQADGLVPEIGLTAYGSTRGQLQLALEPYYYLFHDQVSIWGLLKYQDWIAGYYGRGNDPDIDRYTNFTRKKFQLGTRIESRIGVPPLFKYGIEVHVENSDIEFEEGDITDLPDSHSGWRNGAATCLD